MNRNVDNLVDKSVYNYVNKWIGVGFYRIGSEALLNGVG